MDRSDYEESKGHSHRHDYIRCHEHGAEIEDGHRLCHVAEVAE